MTHSFFNVSSAIRRTFTGSRAARDSSFGAKDLLAVMERWSEWIYYNQRGLTDGKIKRAALPPRTRRKFSFTVMLIGAIGMLASNYLERSLPAQSPVQIKKSQ